MCFVLAGLMGIILLLLWSFALLFTDNFFTQGRRNAVQQAVNEVEAHLGEGEEDFSLSLSRICLHHDVCVVVYGQDGTKRKGGSDLACTVLSLSAESLRAMSERAAEEGAFSEELSLPQLGVEWAGEEDDDVISYTYARLSGDGQQLIVAEGVWSTRSNAARSATLAQSMLVSITIVLLSALTVLVLSQMIAKPIESLNLTARDLAKGKTDLHFDARGYREIEQLCESLNYAAHEISVSEHDRKELIANVSHDLKTPLALIKGYAEMMRDLPGEADAENLQVIIDETQRLTGLVNDLLELGQLERGGEITPTRFCMNTLVGSIVERVGKLLGGEYTLQWEQTEGQLEVVADEKRIEQVVYNLLSNAVNYAGEDKVVQVRLTRHDRNARVEVTDHGEGIDVDVLPRIWDRYYKSDKAHKRAKVGTGLGLSIVKQVIAMHPGGVYGVRTSRGKGSTFYFELPLAEGRGQHSQNVQPPVIQ